MKRMKILCEMGQAERRALLVEFPQEVIQGLDIAKDGTVDTETFLSLMLQYYTNQEREQEEWDQHAQLMNAIYNGSIAVEEHPVRRK